jgi:1-acyl-sn-glycerol-3-phosphate acyltransferase
MAVQAVLLVLPGRGKERFAMLFWSGVAAIFGLRVTVHGRPASARPVLFIGNHCSWLDIVVFGAHVPGCFVAKGAIASWPVISLIARLGRTIFVSRERASVGREQNQLSRRLASGDNVILFPEGTTSDGTRVLPFSSTFLVLAADASRPAVQPTTLVYDGIDGLPVQRRDRPGISWYGDMVLAPHALIVLRRRRLHATLVFDEAMTPTIGRKALAVVLEARLSETAAALRGGRWVPAVTPP